mmetsp:Transcript_33824/g.95756  ORF Transcript_33824/g.95756 Transcript_33824/m.95756 type:complete len:423 (+) Transcript_33824:586-1854(+)
MMMVVNNSTDCMIMGLSPDASSNFTGLWAVSMDSYDGAALLTLLANGTAASVVVWGISGGLNCSAAVLWIMAVGTVIWAAVWSAAESVKPPRARGQPQAAAAENAPETFAMTEKQASMFIVSASVMLVVLFFFVSWAVILILAILFALLSWHALTMMLTPAVGWLMPSLRKAQLCVPLLGQVSGHELGAAVLSAVVAAVWVPCRNMSWAWILQDTLAISFAFMFLRIIHLPNMKVAMILLPMAFLYDIFWVFIEPLIFSGPSVMVKVATGGGTHEVLPMVLVVPYLFSDLPGTSILGLGDIVLPGLLVAYSRAVDVARGRTLVNGYFLYIAAGYAVGLTLTYLALVFSIFGDAGQPALLYLVPCTLGTMSILGLYRGEFKSLMISRDGKLPKPDDGGPGARADTEAPSENAAEGEHASLLRA